MGTPTTGYNFLLFIDANKDKNNPNYIKVAGQRGVSLSRSQDTVDVTDKDSNNHMEYVPSLDSWSLDADGVLELDDNGFTEVQDTFEQKETFLIQLQQPDGSTLTGLAILTELKIEGPHDGEASASMSFQGTGPLTRA